MTIQFNVKIAKDLNPKDIQALYEHGIRRVIDLRCIKEQCSLPVHENLVRQLSCFQIAYEQMPVDNNPAPIYFEAKLHSILSRQASSVLLLTDTPEHDLRNALGNPRIDSKVVPILQGTAVA